MLLKDKVAIITGGTRGIGYSTVKLFLENGAKVVFLGSRQETVDKALEKLKEDNVQGEYEGACPDLLNEEAVSKLAGDVKAKYGSIDILVNNAGISDSTPIDQYTLSAFKKVIDVNVNAVMSMMLPVIKIMKEQGSGVILSTSSMVSISGQLGGAAYPTSKSALNQLTWTLARELAPSGIRVNAVAPGITKTDMVAALPKEVIDPLIRMIPMRRIGDPEDIANAFLFLASDMASYVTGEVLSVDGAMRV